MATLIFDTQPSAPKKAIVACFDASGFSHFCNYPDRGDSIPRYAASMFELFDTLTMSLLDFKLDIPSVNSPKILAPNFIKFTGDGAILIWTVEMDGHFTEVFRTLLVATLRRFQKEYREAVPKWEAKWCVTGIPPTVRVGIAMGSVFPLRGKSGVLLQGEINDYVGYCINLAVRLQSYCPGVGFAVQKCLSPNLPNMKCFIATDLKGAAKEQVWLFEENLKPLDANVLALKFVAN